MARLLIAWELGGGLGHVGPLRAVGEELTRRGHSVRIATANVPLCEQALAGTGVEVLPCPVLPPSEKRLKVPCTFSDILHDCGYASPERVTEAVGEWRKLLDWVEAEAVLADYSPTAMLATRTLGLPSAVFGSGFVCPPDVTPLPSLHPQVTEPHWADEVEAKVLGSMNAALEAQGCSPLERVAQLFADADRRFLLTLPELDHYQGRAANEYVRPFGALPGQPVAWPADIEGPRVFAYLRDEPTTEPLLRGLAIKRIATIAYARGLADDVQAALAGSSVRVVSTPVDLWPLLSECSAAIHHGGHVAACEFLTAGVPQLVLPLSLEQAVTGRRLRACGAGLDAPPEDLNEIANAAESLLKNPCYAEAALAVSNSNKASEVNGELEVARGLDALVKP